MKILCSALISLALLANASAQTRKPKASPPPTGKSKIECTASGITTSVEIDYGTKLILVRENNGPARRSSAKIAKDKISWLVVNSVGSASSRTQYTLDTKTRTLSIAPDRGRRLDSACTAS